MKVVDMHCDTIAEIYKDHKKGGRQSILENQMMLDLKKMQAGDYGLQNFALYVNLEQAKGRPFEFCMELLDTFYQEMEAHEDIIGIVRSYEDISRNWEQGRMSALLTVEEGGTCQGKTAFLRDFGPGEEQLSRISDMVEHMKHIRKIGGIGCIGLGSDFDGISGNLEMGDAGKLPMLAHAMEREGFTPSEIEAVFCKNVLRVYKEVL